MDTPASWGTMEAEEIYMNQQIKMQVVGSKVKKRGKPGNDEGAGDPNYENITLTRHRDQPKGGHPAPTEQDHLVCLSAPVPAQPRPSPDTLQVPSWLHRAIMSLHIFLALIFLFCITLSTLVLVRNSAMSTDLLDLKRQLWNVSNSMRDCCDEQKKCCRNIQEEVIRVKVLINSVHSKVQSSNSRLNMVSTDIIMISEKIQKILNLQEKNTQPTPQ
ncbi:mast cell-expressed membrane protein 1 isoform X1 [Castor canadensis]|uniref:Mast cell-expressed membrane protein 1 isoform X1 n=2 Tax=Castor canadensis TaxID=51338 RepID=A0AC58KZM0_CASCN